MEKNNYLVDGAGMPYVENESLPAGGGLDSRCSYNDDAVHAFDSEDWGYYLEGRGFRLVRDDYPYMETWEKGNTRIVLESRIDGLWGYVRTEFISADTPGVRVYRDDDLEKGWAYEITSASGECLEAGHTYDDDRDASIAYAESIARRIANTYNLRDLALECRNLIRRGEGMFGPFDFADGCVSEQDLYLTVVSNKTGKAVLVSWAFDGDFHRSTVIPESEFYDDEDGNPARVAEALEYFFFLHL